MTRDAVSMDEALMRVVTSTVRAYCTPGSMSWLSTGLRDLDNKIGGIQPAELVVIAGKTSMGKTALASKFAVASARAVMPTDPLEDSSPPMNLGPVLFFSQELTAEQFAQRLIAQEIRVSTDKLRTGDFTQRDFDRSIETSRSFSNLPILIEDDKVNLQHLRNICRQKKEQHDGLRMIVVDSLQTLAAASMQEPSEGVGPTIYGLKALAMELQVPVIVTCPLTDPNARGRVTPPPPPMPTFFALAGGAALEQIADVLLTVHRPEVEIAAKRPDEYLTGANAMERWMADLESAHNRARIQIDKHRNGKASSVQVFFEQEFTRFGDLDVSHTPDGLPEDQQHQ